MTTTLRELSLAHLSVLDATPPELVTVAAAAGFRRIGIRLSATPSVGVPPYDMLGDTPSCARRWGGSPIPGLGARFTDQTARPARDDGGGVARSC